MTTNPDVLKLARSLTEPQRRAILRAPDGIFTAYGIARLDTLDALKRKDILSRDGRKPGAFWSPHTAIEFQFTLIGRILRDHLRQQGQTDADV